GWGWSRGRGLRSRAWPARTRCEGRNGRRGLGPGRARWWREVDVHLGVAPRADVKPLFDASPIRRLSDDDDRSRRDRHRTIPPVAGELGASDEHMRRTARLFYVNRNEPDAAHQFLSLRRSQV